MSRERPILMNGEMVRAILDVRKTQTRRIITDAKLIESCDFLGGGGKFDKIDNDDPPVGVGTAFMENGKWTEDDGTLSDYTGYFIWCAEYPEEGSIQIKCPYGFPGDRLWVRETFFIDHFEFYPTGSLPKQRPELQEGQLLYRADGTCCEQLGECECEGKGAKWRPSIHMPRWASRITLEIVSVRVERLQEISEADAKSEGVPQQLEGSYAKMFSFLWDSLYAKRGFGWDVNPWVWKIEFKRHLSENGGKPSTATGVPAEGEAQ